jgi:hypothetical protein
MLAVLFSAPSLEGGFMNRIPTSGLVCAFTIVLVALLAPNVTAASVPDTGVTKCYDDVGNVITCPSPGQALYGQDANYTINPPSYTKLDSQGNALSDSATSWAMVRDNVTGLIWEVKTNKDGKVNYNDPHDADNTYTWYDPSDSQDPGTQSDHDTKDFLDALNGARFGGYSDWRLPTVKELRSLVDYTRYNPAINTTYFPDTVVSSGYWSSTTDANGPAAAWVVDFSYGYYHYDSGSKGNGYYVRAVRGGQGGSNNIIVVGTNPGWTTQQVSADQQIQLKINSSNTGGDQPVYEWLLAEFIIEGIPSSVLIISNSGVYNLSEVIGKLSEYTFSFDPSGITTIANLTMRQLGLKSGDSFIYGYAYQNQNGAIYIDNGVTINVQ